MDYPNFRLDDQVAIVTGASMGIGYGLAKALANAGAAVIAAARNVPLLMQLVDEIKQEGGQAEAIEMDVTDLEQKRNRTIMCWASLCFTLPADLPPSQTPGKLENSLPH